MGANLQPPGFLEGLTAPAGRGWRQGAPGVRGGRHPGKPSPGRAPTVRRGLPQSLKCSRKTFPRTRASPAQLRSKQLLLRHHSARQHSPPTPSPSAADRRAPRGRLPVPGAADPKSHLIQRAARGRLQQSPGSGAPSSPSRNFPDIALLSAAENAASRQRRRRKRRRRRRRPSRRRRLEPEQKVRSIAGESRRLPICRGVPAPRVTKAPS